MRDEFTSSIWWKLIEPKMELSWYGVEQVAVYHPSYMIGQKISLEAQVMDAASVLSEVMELHLEISSEVEDLDSREANLKAKESQLVQQELKTAQSQMDAVIMSPGPKDVHPFIDAAMLQENAIIASAIRKLLLNYITRPNIPLNGSVFPVSSEECPPGVLPRIGSAAVNFILLPYYTFNYLVSSRSDASRSPLSDKSPLVLLVLIHYWKCVMLDDSVVNINAGSVNTGTLKENSHFHDNPFCKALENARDIEFDRVDIDGNAHNGLVVRLPFTSLFDILGLCLTDENSVLLLYSLIHGSSDFLKYVPVRTDLDTSQMPILETLYNASKRMPNQFYMLLIILLILSQDSSFNASILKLIVPSVPWYQDCLLHHTSLGSLMVLILIRTMKYNLSKLWDVYLHTNCLAILANMAPYVHRLSAYASHWLASLTCSHRSIQN